MSPGWPKGPLAYSPAEPPARNYFFQYNWILPGIFESGINLREHRYFGSCFKEDVGFLLDFWDSARKGHGTALQQYCERGLFSDIEIKAPMAAYRHVRKPYDTAGSLLIQHGSYQWISLQDQPHIEEGEVQLYRGIYPCYAMIPQRELTRGATHMASEFSARLEECNTK